MGEYLPYLAMPAYMPTPAREVELMQTVLALAKALMHLSARLESQPKPQLAVNQSTATTHLEDPAEMANFEIRERQQRLTTVEVQTDAPQARAVVPAPEC